MQRIDTDKHEKAERQGDAVFFQMRKEKKDRAPGRDRRGVGVHGSIKIPQGLSN